MIPAVPPNAAAPATSSGSAPPGAAAAPLSPRVACAGARRTVVYVEQIRESPRRAGNAQTRHLSPFARAGIETGITRAFF